MARAEFAEQSLGAYAQLEKTNADTMLDAIDDAVDLLEADPTNASARHRSFGDGLWGISIRDRHRQTAQPGLTLLDLAVLPTILRLA